MVQELMYTSAPRGLRPGTRGFCTVAATQGMSPLLIEKLESLSGYRALFPPNDGRAGLNPVAYSHLRIHVGGKDYSVLSRVCAAGVDYTDRGNKFAHHLVLEAGELPHGGPAWLMQQPHVMASAWNGEVQWLPPRAGFPRGDSMPSVCTAWHRATGDAGWAGVVAEAMLSGADSGICLLFEPGIEILPLIGEGLALLPAEVRWGITFSTYSASLPQGLECRCRCFAVNTPEAKAATKTSRGLVLNLGASLGKAEGGALVETARTGRRPRTPEPAQEMAQAMPSAGRPGAVPRPLNAGALPYAVSPEPQYPPVDEAPRNAGRPAAAPPPPPPRTSPNSRGRRRRSLLIAGLAVPFLVILAFLGYKWKIGYSRKPEPAALATATVEPVARKALTEVSPTEPTATQHHDDAKKVPVNPANGSTGKSSSGADFRAENRKTARKPSPDDASHKANRAQSSPRVHEKPPDPTEGPGNAGHTDWASNVRRGWVDRYFAMPAPQASESPSLPLSGFDTHADLQLQLLGPLRDPKPAQGASPSQAVDNDLIGNIRAPLQPRPEAGKLFIETAGTSMNPTVTFGWFAVATNQMTFTWAPFPKGSKVDQQMVNRQQVYRELRRAVLRISHRDVVWNCALREPLKSNPLAVSPALSPKVSTGLEDNRIYTGPLLWSDAVEQRASELFLDSAEISWRGQRLKLDGPSEYAHGLKASNLDVEILLAKYTPKPPESEKKDKHLRETESYLHLQEAEIWLTEDNKKTGEIRNRDIRLRLKAEIKGPNFGKGAEKDYDHRDADLVTDLRIVSLVIFTKIAGIRAEVFRIPRADSPSN